MFAGARFIKADAARHTSKWERHGILPANVNFADRTTTIAWRDEPIMITLHRLDAAPVPANAWPFDHSNIVTILLRAAQTQRCKYVANAE